MRELSPELIKMCKENPEVVSVPEFASYKLLEIQIKKFGLENYSKELNNKLERIWMMARSYWLFPESEDINKLIDSVVKKQ